MARRQAKPSHLPAGTQGDQQAELIISQKFAQINTGIREGLEIMSEQTLEERVRNLEVRQAMIEQRMDTVAQDVKDIKNILQKLNWLLISAIVVAGLNLIIKF